MDDEVSTAITCTAPGGTVLRDETQGAKMAEGWVEVEEGSVEAEEATFVGVHNYLLATDKSSEGSPRGTTRSRREDSVEKLKGSKVTPFSGQRCNFNFAALLYIIHSWFMYFRPYR